MEPTPRHFMTFINQHRWRVIRSTLNMRLSARSIALRALSLVEKAKPTQVCFTLQVGTNGVCECKMDVKSMWIYVVSNGSCFMVIWTIFNNHLLEVGLAQKWETMAIMESHNRQLIIFYDEKIIELAFGSGPMHI